MQKDNFFIFPGVHKTAIVFNDKISIPLFVANDELGYARIFRYGFFNAVYNYLHCFIH